SMYWRPVGQVIFANWLATTSAMSGKSPIHSSRRLVPGSRLVFTDGEKWRLLIVFLSHGAGDATLDPGLWRWPEISFSQIAEFGPKAAVFHTARASLRQNSY